MSRQDKATTDRFTRTLRELVKRPDNKLCADCKRNDPRWASWNLGVFLCIRCSGIHRGMGTHISKVKSVDLDVWTPEQMQSIQKWGNRLANLYWEAHLKAGHQPPEHKMESFIRSKYESRRWALDGPPPPDPSVLDSEAGASEEPGVDTAPAPVAVATTPDPIGWGAPSPPRASNSTVNRQPQPRQLISAGHATNSRTSVPLVRPPPGQQAPVAPAPAPPAPAPQGDLFSLDFHAPAAPASPPAAPKNAKQDILSLFSTPAAAPAPAFGQFQQQQSSPWGAPTQQQQYQQQYQQQQTQLQAQPQSMMGGAGTGMWGASSGWAQQSPPQQQQSNLWGAPAPQQQQPQFGAVADTNNVWGGMVSAGSGGSTDLFASAPAQQQKKDDAFGDLWGGFK
ncbi:hypothetical protein DFH08DRAFT_849399 [Mycena albidolilacea]|uniref:Arf-GAP domain-containing protein n=1 Tax=Mycena albidolilacea TaxID=1033008 RepID=A0AAD7AE96_9AGAR|nr:hypothetical protein DFH08DRAFT_849399 [Mycena albidolilacea]